MGKIDFVETLVYPHPLLYGDDRPLIARFGEWRTGSGQLRWRRVPLSRGVARIGSGVYSRPIHGFATGRSVDGAGAMSLR